MSLLLALLCTGAWAENITTEQALNEAMNFLMSQETTSGKPRRAQGTTPQLTLASRVSGLYVFNVENDGGFVVVSNDDRTRPILGFGESGSFDPDVMPDNMRAWLQGYADEIAWLQEHGSTATDPRKARNKVGTHSTAAVVPLCTSTWNQDTPYNNLCPTYSDGWYGSGKCATGCVATAMAQVMYYHKWPAKSTKVIPAYTTYSYNMSLSSLPVVTFDWTHMKNSYSGSYTSTEATAVATLMKYCGYGVKMDYGPSSGAYTEDVAIALREYFDYNPYTTRFVSRSSYTYENWTDLIYHEVSHNRPVCYGGLSDGGGHEFVCDGYKFEQNTDFFHINWGWGGLSDNYFVLSALDPDQQGIGGSTSTDGFHYGQDAVIGIQKSTASGTTADVSPNIVDLTLNSITLSETAVEPNTAVNITFNVTNNSTDPYDGDLWLCLRQDDDDYLIECESVVIPAQTTQNVVITYSPTQTGSYTFVFCYINAEGEYVVSEEATATLTVAENLTNGVVPVYGYWTDNYSRSQFIIAEANIEDMMGATITGVTFYASESSISWGSAKFDVYLSEVSQSTISSLKTWSTLDKVYSGSLSVVNKKMTITFDEPYYYQGGNLLVGINQTQTGSYQKVSWHGESVNGVSVGGYGSSISQQNFLPKTDFDFIPGANPPVKTPKNLAVSYNGGTEATVSWTSLLTSFDIDVNGTVTENVANPCTLTCLELATTYTIKVRAKDGENVSDWTEPVSFTTDLSAETCQIRLELTDLFGDGWSGAAIKIVDVLTGTEFGTFTNTNEAKKNEAQVYAVEVPNDRDIEFQWIKGNYDHECVYAAYDVAGNLIFSGKKRMTAPVTYHVDCNAAFLVELANSDDNTGLLESIDGKGNCNVTLANRTLYKDGSWNTLCLPFNLNDLTGTPLEGATMMELGNSVGCGTGYNASTGTLTLDFVPAYIIEAGHAYLVKWEQEGDPISNPTFIGVTINSEDPDNQKVISTDGNVQFKGTYTATTFTDENQSILFIGSGNKLHHPIPGATIGAQRAYFQLISSSPAKQFVLTFGEDDATGISLTPTLSDGEGEWFDLSGRKLAGKPTIKGIYVNGGRKVSIK